MNACSEYTPRNIPGPPYNLISHYRESLEIMHTTYKDNTGRCLLPQIPFLFGIHNPDGCWISMQGHALTWPITTIVCFAGGMVRIPLMIESWSAILLGMELQSTRSKNKCNRVCDALYAGHIDLASSRVRDVSMHCATHPLPINHFHWKHNFHTCASPLH